MEDRYTYFRYLNSSTGYACPSSYYGGSYQTITLNYALTSTGNTYGNYPNDSNTYYGFIGYSKDDNSNWYSDKTDPKTTVVVSSSTLYRYRDRIK